MNDNGPITMKDIAARFGVSVATVSRALSGNGRVSSGTRAAIKAYAEEHNFFPNVIGEQLRHMRSRPIKIIGVIIPQFVHYYFSTILSGIEEEASAQGYQIVCAQSNEQFEREKDICNNFYKNKVCGVIVSQAKDTVSYDHFRRLLEQEIPLVFYDRISPGVNASRVVVDDYDGAFTAVSHLVETGCRRIAFFGATMTMEISKNRYNGYKDALLRHGIEPDPQLHFTCDNRADAERLLPQLLDRPDRPDAIFAINDDTAVGIVHAAKRAGLRVPDDLSVCGFTNGERAIACDPMLTTVEQNGFEVGREAADVLIGFVEGRIPHSKVERRVVRTRLIVRGTTKEKPQTGSK